VVWPCLASAARLVEGRHDVDVLVLDDCTPDDGFSKDLAELCAKLGLQHYRSPRNLGVPRNMNLGLLRALDGGYEHVVLLNSDTVVPATLVDRALAVLEAESDVASFTPWSNNATLFSLPLGDGAGLSDQDTVDLLDGALADEFGDACLDVPTGVGFCLAVPVAVLREVGLMDPVFGRGYCEEVDWCQRARAAGYRSVLGFGSFTFHHGGASNRPAGLLRETLTTVLDHERIVEMRYPGYHDGLAAFDDHPELEAARMRAIAVAADALLRRDGYDLVLAALDLADDQAPAHVVLDPFRRHASVRSRGVALLLAAVPSPAELIARCGPPRRVLMRDRGPASIEAAELGRASGIPVEELAPYPSPV
jgi:GT2 family glycosyltransferase